MIMIKKYFSTFFKWEFLLLIQIVAQANILSDLYVHNSDIFVVHWALHFFSPVEQEILPKKEPQKIHFLGCPRPDPKAPEKNTVQRPKKQPLIK